VRARPSAWLGSVLRGTSAPDVSCPEPTQWNGDPPADDPLSPPIYYRCLTCDWAGRGGVSAYDHHCDHPTHALILRDAPQLGAIHFGDDQ